MKTRRGEESSAAIEPRRAQKQGEAIYQTEGLSRTIRFLHRDRRFFTPATLRATTIVGTAAEVIDQLKTLERAGLGQVFLNPPMDGFEEYVDSFASEIIHKM